jgi:DNA repair exonuclease SbcCD ATPase subunit
VILRKVTLSNWRALEKFEMNLEVGLNVLQGRNEAGKSSVVEAIDWALYRDISGARIRAEEVRALVPARDPNARPSVEVELEFPDCRALLLKILAEDSGKRECRLTLRRDGHADEFFDRTEAQRRLRALFSADGLGTEKGSVASGGLLVSHQGESADFLSDGTAGIRSTLGIGNDGELALTARLERARAAVETLRRKEILQDLERSAIEVARAGTDAALARDRLKETRFQLEHFEQVTREIEDLRSQIEELGVQIGEMTPREVVARKRVEELGALLMAQNDADKAVLNAQSAEREAKTALDGAKNRADDIARLRHLQNEAQRELEGSEGAVETARLALENARSSCDTACDLQEATGRDDESARHAADAWRHYYAVFEAKTALSDEKKALEGLQALGADLLQTQKSRDTTPKAPSFDEIRNWKNAFENLKRLEGEAALGIQLEIRVQNDIEVGWKADGGTLEKKSVTSGKNASFGALSEGVLKIAGVGALRVRTGARGIEELKAEVATAKTTLEAMLSEWRVDVEALPGAFEIWEWRRSTFEKAENLWKEAADSLKREENRLGSLHEAQKRVAERETEYQAAKEACKPFEGVIELGGKKRGEVKQALEAADQEARTANARANRARNDAASASQNLRKTETEFHNLKARPDALREAMASRALELARLENDELTPEARSTLLDEFNQTLARARIELGSAQSKRREMGDGVSHWKLEEARRAAAALSEEREKVEKTLAQRERDLYHACQQDANAEIERLKVVIEGLEIETARHEARLRGLSLLDAAIQAERARLSRDLAGPLNEKLGPWLSQLRGKETKLAFDEAGSRIENVLTKDGDSTISLPFSEHSEGLKEQVAFALRLLLATRVASHLPSKRLPVVLDDPFTQSDASRRGGLGEVLKDAAQTLQLLFVTCHGAPQIDGMEVNTIRLGDWDEAVLPSKPRPKTVPKTSQKTMKKVEKKTEKIVMDSVPESEETLALF